MWRCTLTQNMHQRKAQCQMFDGHTFWIVCTDTPTPTAKFLSVTFDQHLSWGAVNNLEKGGWKRLQDFNIICRKIRGASAQTAMKVYQSYIRPMFEYASPAWCNASKTHIQQLQVIQSVYVAIKRHTDSQHTPTHTKYIHDVAGLISQTESLSLAGNTATEQQRTLDWRTSDIYLFYPMTSAAHQYWL